MVAFAKRDDVAEVRCRQCGVSYSIMYNREDMLDWLSGSGYIQDLMPYLSSGERELFISGTCDNCWQNMFGTDLDSDDE